MQSNPDDVLAGRYGGYASFPDPSGPVRVDYYGDDPAAEIDRLLDLHVTSASCVLDIGCGAGFSLCRLATTARECWGIDVDQELLTAAQRRAERDDLSNVTLLAGDSTRASEMAQLPAAHFDVALSRRGPNLNAALLHALGPDAIFIQELVSAFDGYPLQELFGRRPWAPYDYLGAPGLLAQYAELGLLPVSVKEYYSDQYFRDAEHLALYLRQPGPLSNWRLRSLPYEPSRDRTALDLYVRYHTTPHGVRVMRQRTVFVLRRGRVTYYPVEQ